MMINDLSKRVIPFRPHDAKRVGDGCYYLDWIVWLNGNRIEMGEKVIFNVGCYVNGYGGLVLGDRTGLGPYAMVHTANHIFEDVNTPLLDQGHDRIQPVQRRLRKCLQHGLRGFQGAPSGKDPQAPEGGLLLR